MNRSNISKTHSSLRGRQMTAPLVMQQIGDAAVGQLARIGIHIDSHIVHEQVRALYSGATEGRAIGDSAFTAPVTAASVPTPLQFLQTWLPGFVKVLTAARKIDELLGIKTVGSWEDQEIVQGIVEPSGTPAEYGDFTNVPLASWNVNFERRTIVRGEMGMVVGLLEEGRAAAMRLNSAEEKRQGAAMQLEIFRNAVGLYGWNNGTNRTYGFLNDPNLPAAITSATIPTGSQPGGATGASLSGWATGTFQQITADIRTMVHQLRVQSQDQIDPENVDLTLALPVYVVDYLTTTTDFGISVRDWIKQTYPKMRIVSVPELNWASSTGYYSGPTTYSTNVAVLFAEEVESSIDGSSDGGEVFIQMVQSKFMTYGVEKRAKSYIEDFGNATAGTMLKRPYAVVRMLGI